jgi:hypothetical protein
LSQRRLLGSGGRRGLVRALSALQERGPTGQQAEDADDQADDGQGAGRGGIVLGLVPLGGQGGVDPGGLAVGPDGQLAPGGLLDRVLDLGRVVDVGERLGSGLEGLVDLLALDGAGEMEAVAARRGGDEERPVVARVPNSPTSKLGSIGSWRASAPPVVTSTFRVLPRSMTGLSLASARMSWTLFFSPA